MISFLDACIQQNRARYPALTYVLGVLKILPISWRKIVIKSCQLGHILPGVEREFIQASIDNPISSSHALNIFHFLSALQDNLYHPLFRSTIWIFARTIPEPPDHDEYLTVVESTFFKEFRAATTIFSDYQLFQYGDFLLDTPIERPTAPPFAKSVRRIIDSFSVRMRRLGVLYPNVQRTKNVSMETGVAYGVYRQSDPQKVTTKDLEVLYGESGIQIGGCCELREAWKFNDLKPRLYYCQGGRDYFKSRYTKPIALLLLECIQTTKYNRRIDPTTELGADLAEWITTWDLASFTTNLSELKFFLYWFARGLEDRCCGQIELFDYHLGQVFVDIWDLIDEYNEVVNCHSPFSIWKIIDRFAFAADFEVEDYVQSNSGSLGVAGNIGFSMANHGTVIEMSFGPDSSVCVGDDAFTIHQEAPEQVIIPTISYLGDIQYEKFESLEPEDFGPFRFLKRAIYREPSGRLYIDFLLNLPIPNYVDEQLGHRTPPIDFSPFARMKKFAIQTGQLLWSLCDLPLEQTERIPLDFLGWYLKHGYRRLGLPQNGALPGFQLRIPGRKDSERVMFAIPSLLFHEYDPRAVDWLEFQFTKIQAAYMIPVKTPRGWKPKIPDPGDIIYTPQMKLWSALEDMGYVTTKKVYEMVFVLDQDNKRKISLGLKRVISDLVSLVEVSCVRYIDIKFEPFFCDPCNLEYPHAL